MKILVIDDTEIHRQAALQTLEGHDVNVAKTYDDAYAFLHDSPTRFEAVLCDLLMPASKMTMGDKGLQYVGHEMPCGFALVLMAVLSGAKYVVLGTNTNHHDHPASAWLDRIANHCDSKYYHAEESPLFNINGAHVGFFHAPLVPVDGTVCESCQGTGASEGCYCVERQPDHKPKPDCDSCNGTGRRCWPCRNSGKRYGKNWAAMLTLVMRTPGGEKAST